MEEEERRSQKVRKPGSPKVVKKPEVRSPRSGEENNSAPDSYRDDIPNSEINKQFDPDNYRDEHPKSEIKDMEVHHHPEVEKKGLKEYILEGLMIFLAVFMGFIAENIREHVADGERETQYMKSLVKDLKLDTTILNVAATAKKERILAIDSILTYFRAHKNAKKTPLSTFRQMRRSRFDMFFIHHGGTIDQLKNSGGLRLIRVKGIIDSIELYYQKVQRSESRNTMYFLNQQVADDLSEKLLDAYDDIKYYQDFVLAHKALPDSGSMSINTPYLNEYLNNLIGMRVYTNSDRLQFTLDIKNNAGRLIALIKKEYDLE